VTALFQRRGPPLVVVVSAGRTRLPVGSLAYIIRRRHRLVAAGIRRSTAGHHQANPRSRPRGPGP